MTKLGTLNPGINDWTITVHDNGYFYADGNDQPFATFSAAREFLQDRAKLEEKATREKLSLPVIHQYGDRVFKTNITGIHAANHTLLFSPKVENQSFGYILPDHPTVAALVEKVRELQQQMRPLTQALHEFSISNSLGRRRGVAMGDLLDDLKQTYAEALAKVEAYEPPGT